MERWHKADLLQHVSYPKEKKTRHSLMLHWFADLMNVTEEVTIHRIIMNKVFTIQSFETKITRLRSDDE